MSLKSLEERIKKAGSGGGEGYHIFSNERRREIFRELTRRPCRTVSSLASTLSTDTKVVSWHITKMMEKKLVSRWKAGRTYYYPAELVRPGELELFRILNSKEARKIINHAYHGCTSLEKLPVQRTTMYRYLKIYEEMELIELSGARKKYMCGTEKLKSMVEEYDLIGKNYKKKFLELVEKRGFHVRVIGTVNYELKIEFTGLENFTMGIYISPLRTAMEVHR